MHTKNGHADVDQSTGAHLTSPAALQPSADLDHIDLDDGESACGVTPPAPQPSFSPVAQTSPPADDTSSMHVDPVYIRSTSPPAPPEPQATLSPVAQTSPSAEDSSSMHVDPVYSEDTCPPPPPVTQAASSPVAQMALASADDSAMHVDPGRDETPSPAEQFAPRRSSRVGQLQAAAAPPATASSRGQRSSRRRRTRHKAAPASPATPHLETKPQVTTSRLCDSDTPRLTEIIDLTQDLEEVSVLDSFFLSMSNLHVGCFSRSTGARQEQLL